MEPAYNHTMIFRRIIRAIDRQKALDKARLAAERLVRRQERREALRVHATNACPMAMSRKWLSDHEAGVHVMRRGTISLRGTHHGASGEHLMANGRMQMSMAGRGTHHYEPGEHVMAIRDTHN